MTGRLPAARPEAIERLPARLRRRIAEQEHQSEVLIGWVQLALCLIFATLYAVSPKAFESGSVALEPVPWALGAYFALTVARLTWVRAKGFPPWSLAVSVVADVLLLMALIWSFHIQYQQPESFYLKAPTLLYVFIFIALRALRFDYKYVLMAGLAAALGWGALLLNAVWAEAGSDMITRSYVEYLTGNKILIGAEFDKIIAILLVTAILTVALLRARRLLVAAVADGAAAKDLSRFFAPEVARRITGAEHQVTAGHGELRVAAVLMLDIRGFTRMATALAPDAVIRLLIAYERRMMPVIRRHGGVVDKFMGDGIMATFGAASPSSTYAADALAAAHGALAAVAEWNAERAKSGHGAIALGVAVAVGPVVFGAIGDADRLEYTVIGDAVNLAAKLEDHNKTLATSALATREAFDLASRQGATMPHKPEILECQTVPGLDHPIDVVVLARHHAGAGVNAA